MIDDLLRAFQIDLSEGLEVRTAARLAEAPPPGGAPLLVCGAAPGSAARLQALLLAHYPPAHPVGLYRDGAVAEVRLDGLAAHEWANYALTLYLRPVGRTERKRWPLDPLVEVMARLRSADGCPWDREQTHESLRRYMLEEAYEVVEAIDQDDPRHLCEELGDVLLQVVFHAQIAREAGRFDMSDVVSGITEKLIRRHPHVFGEAVAETAADVTRTWEAIKRSERGDQAPPSVLSGVSGGLPALSRALELQKRAARVGFDWPDAAGPADKVREELDEVLSAEPADQEGEVGDLLFAVVNLARKLKVDPEIALTRTNARFIRRFRYVEEKLAERGLRVTDVGLSEMDLLWDEAKRAEFGEKYRGK
ncbi:nucleoside triphosphate pyrophosphohydrolase [Symbiobacterium terraclitae]|uniref:nucleoside triphosphate pyrophosphohydrolase n=1 Tax=Symbiobacterium terraclitae TaxID=557451 RepID=UPI0035B50A86